MRDGVMNASTCSALLEQVAWDDPGLIASLVVLLLINVMVIVGNCLVIAAVFMSSKLRSVTNLFIVSLAVADLMVGLAVLPFSATWEVFKVWIFGDVWCSIWLAVDVWMCTASILNLCAISLDRYVAVTRPVTYPSIMSSGRAKLLIAGVWVLSFVICFPPLVGWKDKREDPPSNSSGSLFGSRPLTPPPALQVPAPCPWICELTNDAGYVVYSALGSFYLPMLVMLFFYWRIYRAAVQTTRAINQGFRTTKGSRTIGNRFDEQRLTLRIHRGRGSSVMRHGPTPPPSSSQQDSSVTETSLASSACGSPSSGATSSSAVKSPECQRLTRSSTRRSNKPIKISVSYPSSDAICMAGSNNGGVPSSSPSPNSSKKSSFSSSSPPPGLYSVHYSNGGREATSSVYRSRDPNCHLRVTGSRLASHNRRGSSVRRRSSTDSTLTPGAAQQLLEDKDLSPSPTFDDSGSAKPKLISRMGKRNIKAQVKRFRMETKAAKTLGIIVGGFIVCWLPFFTMYLVRAFCEDCIHHLLFSVLFWLGYCNSAINPCIYALFSKDFRFAFKRIICRCFCARKIKKETRDWARRRGSDGSQLGARGPEPGSERGRSPSNNNTQQYPHNSVGEDSDQGNDGSDSR
ncbi:probable G-protein coupled receptor No9 [Periplaneta americana]|uniref:Octopamine receptor n=1 Tax=Periplaneta americana TaxID=6978 RepID=Q7YWB7_PERAM|nr:octopamine receptor [Periplaneta americana]